MDMNTTVKAIHTITGLTAWLPKRVVDHAILGQYLVEVADDAKPYADGLFKPTTPEDFVKAPRRSRRNRDEPVVDVLEPEATVSFGAQIDEDN